MSIAPTSASEAVTHRVRHLSRVLCAVIALAMFAADQTSKAVIERSVGEREVIPVIPGLFNLINTKNSGAAFSLFAESSSPWKMVVLIGISAILLLMVIGIVWKSQRLDWLASLGLALILGGALSNLADRVRYGRVVDFVDVYYRSYHWPTFNLADSAIVVGAGFLILHVISASE
jgi:signal peptidase II